MSTVHWDRTNYSAPLKTEYPLSSVRVIQINLSQNTGEQWCLRDTLFPFFFPRGWSRHLLTAFPDQQLQLVCLWQLPGTCRWLCFCDFLKVVLHICGGFIYDSNFAFYYTRKLHSYHHPGELHIFPNIIKDYQKTKTTTKKDKSCHLQRKNWLYLLYNDPDQCNVMKDSWCDSEKSVSVIHHPDTYFCHLNIA